MRPAATHSIAPTSVRTMWRMKLSAVIQYSSTSPCSTHSERVTSRVKREW